MSDPEVIVEADPEIDEEMAEGDVDVDETEGEANGSGDAGLEAIEPETPSRTSFLDYLISPIVELVIGTGDSQTILHAHQGLLTQSPFLAGECARFTEGTTQRRIILADDDVEATASVLEYLYKADYFPALSSNTTLEFDPSVPSQDNSGLALLRHAKVYTLAQRLGLPALAGLAHKKIHMTNSTARGEIAYARFVYRETSADDINIRKPVAAFWATRSHVLRHEAELEFKRMCLEFPQFGFDVLTLVLDQQERRSQTSTTGPGRKRQRVSGVEIR